MAISFGSNIQAQQAISRLSESARVVARSTERLSSGLRINRGADDAAGLAIASQLNASGRVYTQGVRNLNDGISALSIIDSALESGSNILTRIKELAQSSANGTLSRSQRISLDTEARELTNEYNRIYASTQFNGLSLINGSIGELRLQSGFGVLGGLTINPGQAIDRNVSNGNYTKTKNINNSGLYFSWSGGAQVGDFNSDGKDDFAIIQADNDGSDQIYIYESDGNGGFQENGSFLVSNNEASNLVIADFNNDGRKDLAWYDQATSNVEVSLNQGGAFSSSTVVGNSGYIVDLKAGDFNGDGKTDLVAAGSFGVTLLTNSTSAVPTFSSSRVSTASAFGIEKADLNADGKLDIFVLISGGASTLLGNGNGGFASVSALNTGLISSILTLDDIDHNGTVDLVAGDGFQTRIYKGNGDGSFSASTVLSSPSSSLGNKTVDINGDGNVDIVTTANSGAGEKLGVYYGDGQGSFSTFQKLENFGLSNVSYFSSGDFNGDGVTDLLSVQNNDINAYVGGTSRTTTIARLDLTTQSSARSALDTIETLLNNLAAERGNIGASQSRLQSALAVSNSTIEGYATASSRITDADIASEAAEATRGRILQEVASAIVSQANQLPRIALSLLQNA